MVRRCAVLLVLGSGLACGVLAGSVSVADQNATWGGISGCLKIVSTGATYYFSKTGGGFAGIVDKDGHDWIGHSTAGGAAGQYRGLPNTNEIGWRPE